MTACSFDPTGMLGFGIAVCGIAFAIAAVQVAKIMKGNT